MFCCCLPLLKKLLLFLLIKLKFQKLYLSPKNWKGFPRKLMLLSFTVCVTVQLGFKYQFDKYVGSQILLNFAVILFFLNFVFLPIRFFFLLRHLDTHLHIHFLYIIVHLVILFLFLFLSFVDYVFFASLSPFTITNHFILLQWR